MQVTKSITKFLAARCRHPMLSADVDVGCMEIQVNVVTDGPGEPVEGKRNSFRHDGFEYFNFRIPKNAATDPTFTDWSISWPLDLYTDKIGMTGWDFKNKVSRWVGFDFDSIIGHADGVGISQEELDSVRQAAMKLPYVYPITSTSGNGLHLYVRLAPGVKTVNHTEHSALAKAVLAQMSKDAGYDFAADVDCYGGILWIWARDQQAEGFRALKDHCPAELSEPKGWRDSLPATVVTARTDEWEALTAAYAKVPLDSEHVRVMTALSKIATTIWDNNNHLMRTHSCALKQLHIGGSIRGTFEDDSPGTDLKTANCFAFPLPNGGWKVHRFGGDNEPREYNVAPKETPATAFNPPPEKESSIAAKLIEIATKEGQPFHTPGGEPHITVSVDGHRMTYPINSKEFKSWLQFQCFDRFHRSPPKGALDEVISTVEAVAQFKGETSEVYHRYVCSKDRAYLDLCNDQSEVVEIDAHGWRVIPCPEHIKFIRVRGQLPLPHPEPGRIDELRKFISVADERSWYLLVGGLLCCLQPVAPYWVTILQSPHGSGKTTTLRLLRRIIDPNEADVRSSPKKEDGLLLAAKFGLMVAIDNASTLPDWLADALCRLATGSGLSDRAFFTQKEEFVMSAQRPTFITTIVDLTGREDLWSRCLLVNCGTITSENRLAESDLFASYYEVRPRILGALLTAVSAGLANLPTTKPEKLPRMADAYRWVLSCEPGLGWAPGTFEKAYAEAEQSISETVMSHPVAVALRSMLKNEKQWTGNASSLSQALLEYVDSVIISDDAWPKNAQAWGRVIQRLASNLRDSGVSVEQGRNRTWTFSLN